MKFCRGCLKWKPFTEYNKRTDSKFAQYRSKCKACVQPNETVRQRNRRAKSPQQWQDYMDAYRDANKERILKQAITSHFRRKFGITIEERDAMLAAQNSQCAICGTDTPKSKKGFVVDHDKRTNKIRAILCAHCNTGIGHLQHSPRILRAAALYMETHNEYREHARTTTTGVQLVVVPPKQLRNVSS